VFELELINLILKIMIHFQRKNNQRLTVLDKVWKYNSEALKKEELVKGMIGHHL